MTFRGNHVDELISASLTGDLTDAERLELNAHLVRCETCRATLAAFTAERRILSGMPVAEPPRDLSARVRTGIESGRSGGSWWRRPGGLIAFGASVATVAAALLAVVIIGELDFAPVGNASNSPVASVSSAPGPSAVETSAASAAPTPIPAFALGPGELGYLSLTGAPLETLRLSVINDATGASLDLGTVSGPPIAASLSPNGQWLAYITQKGETGANEVWAVHLTDGKISALGCSQAAPFTDRLTWSPKSHYLAYTLIAVDLGLDSGCPAAGTGIDAWLFDTGVGQRSNFSQRGISYAGSFTNEPTPNGSEVLWVSVAGGEPGSGPFAVGEEIDGIGLSNIFVPRFSPDGNRAIFLSGTMAESGGAWQFSRGGMPQLSGDFRSAAPASPWIGTPLFSDLTAVGGEAFASGKFTWGPASDLFAFWDGAWTGAPQSADGSYPSQTAVYVGRISTGLLSKGSTLGLIRPEGTYIVDVTFSPDGTTAAVTIGLPSAGIGDPPSAYVEIVPLDDGSTKPYTIGGGVEPPPWNGPAIYGY